MGPPYCLVAAFMVAHDRATFGYFAAIESCSANAPRMAKPHNIAAMMRRRVLMD